MERVFAITLMLLGVFSFSMLSSSVAMIVQNQDQSNAAHQEKLTVLNRLAREHYLPFDLVAKLKQSISLNHSKGIEDQSQFIEGLPHNLKMELSLYLYEDFKTIYFLKLKTPVFISWLCPLLKPSIMTESEYIYGEGDPVGCIYFLKEGQCGFVLPQYSNQKYIDIPKGVHFGVHDIIGYVFQSDDEELGTDNWDSHKSKLTRQFTVLSEKRSHLYALSVDDFNKMNLEFNDQY